MGLRRVLAVVGLALAVASCASKAPAPERVVRYRMKERAPSLDPVKAYDDNSLVYIYLIFDGLVEFVPGSVEVRPAVAESWTLSDDHLTYTFKLRRGVRFHNGREVTADDVVYSLRRALTRDAKSVKYPSLNALKGASEFWDGRTADLAGAMAPDPSTVILTLAYPYDAFLSALASEAGSIMPREVYSDPGEKYLDHPVGCGPFQMESFEPGVSYTLARFAGHWKTPPAGAIEKIEVRMIGSAATAVQEYRAGSLDFTQEIPPGQRETLRREMPAHFHNWQKLQLFYVGFNFASGPLKDNRLLRRAILHAIDSEFIVRVLQEGKDTLATGIIPPGMLGYGPSRETAYDPNLAGALLAQAGHPGGMGIEELSYVTNDTEGFRRIAERFQADLARIGIHLRIKTMDFGAYLAAIDVSRPTGPDADMYRQNFYPDYPDPDNFMSEQFVPGRLTNASHYDNPEVTRLLDQGRLETDRARRESLYRQAEKLVIEDAALVPVYWAGQDILLRPEVTGFAGSPIGVFAIPWEEMSLNR